MSPRPWEERDHLWPIVLALLLGAVLRTMQYAATPPLWYDEIAKYSFKKPTFSMETGHFTQVVWTTTTQVGCGMTQCKGLDIWVCNYDPPGNWEGQYPQHVLPASCKK